jgi:hypothetical protein
MTTVSLRPRSATEIVDAMFQLLREHYPQFATIVAVAFLPQLLLGLVLPAEYVDAAGVVAVLTGPLATGAVVLAVSDAYLGRPVDGADSLRRAASHLGALVLVGLGQGLFVALGFVLLVVPGFIFLAWTAVAPAVVALESSSAGDAFTRSRELARGQVGHVLGAVFVGGIIYFVGMLVIGMLAGFASLATAFGPRMVNLLTQIVQILLYPVLAVTVTLLYYDLRIRKEGFDIEMMAGELGGRAPVAAPPARATP